MSEKWITKAELSQRWPRDAQKKTVVWR